MDDVVEKMSPKFARDGYALLVLTQKNYSFWTDADVTALMDKTLPEVSKIDGVDAKKPILLGFSAGGQVALQLWRQHPDAYGGLVVDAAYPLDMEKYAAGQVAPFALPKDPAIKACPIFVLVGGADGGSKMWSAVEKTWRDAEIPLSVYIKAGAGHAWLFDKEHASFLHDWLKQVGEGQLPTKESKPRQPLKGVGENEGIKV
jgi:predicted esterase